MNPFRKTLLAATAAFGLAASAHAAPILVIFDDTNLVTIEDNGAGDSSSGVGQITWVGSNFGIWNLVVSTGITGGNSSTPTLHLNVVANSLSGGFLGVYYGDTDFGPTNGQALASIGGTIASGVLENYTYLFDGNDVSDPGYFSSLLTSASYTGNPFAFSGAASAYFSSQGPYGLANAVFLTTNSGGASSIDAHLSVPDSASTALLLGLGLLGLGAVARREKLLA